MKLTALLLLLLSPAAFGAEPGARLAANCAACHGTNGAGKGDTLPTLAGQPKDELMASMRAFKAGTRPATIMHQIAKGYTDEQVEQIATWLSNQKK
jgi:cytochrome subunit of sulfide dehydrogenase